MGHHKTKKNTHMRETHHICEKPTNNTRKHKKNMILPNTKTQKQILGLKKMRDSQTHHNYAILWQIHSQNPLKVPKTTEIYL
jgi:hypothetical protein